MREQVVAQKVGGRVGLSTKRTGPMQQKPAKRGSRESGASFADRLRFAARYLPFFGKVAVGLIVAILIIAAYRAAASATFFQVRHIEVKGTTRASADQIQQVVRRNLAEPGVWRADLDVISTQLERLPWVRTAVVSRLLPDGVRVRITERVQRAVVRTGAGRLMWVDDDAVVLGEMAPTDQIPTFFLRGWSEESTEAAHNDNRERVQKFLELQREWDAAGLSERVSEVNLIDVRDIRAQLAGDDSQIEIRLGSKDPGVRLKKALSVLDEQRNTPRGGAISYLDLSQGKRAIVGFTSGRQVNSDSSPASSTNDSTNPESESSGKPAIKVVKAGGAKPGAAKNLSRPRTN